MPVRGTSGRERGHALEQKKLEARKLLDAKRGDEFPPAEA